MFLKKVSDGFPEKKGQYLTLELANDKEVELYETGKLIPAIDDWCVYGYDETFRFYDYDLNRNEYTYYPQYWAELPVLK